MLRDSASVIWDTGLERMEADFADKAAKAAEMDVELIHLDEAERAVFREACQPVYDKYKDIIGEEFYNWYTELVASKIA